MEKVFILMRNTHPVPVGSDIIAPYKTLYSNYVNLYIHEDAIKHGKTILIVSTLYIREIMFMFLIGFAN
jgi:adenine/guanine phosphoribosyltransferase-like PRPP-binding protein